MIKALDSTSLQNPEKLRKLIPAFGGNPQRTLIVASWRSGSAIVIIREFHIPEIPGTPGNRRSFNSTFWFRESSEIPNFLFHGKSGKSPEISCKNSAYAQSQLFPPGQYEIPGILLP